MTSLLTNSRPAPGATTVWTISYIPPDRASAYVLRTFTSEAEARDALTAAAADPKAFVNQFWRDLVGPDASVSMDQLNLSSGPSQILKG